MWEDMSMEKREFKIGDTVTVDLKSDGVTPWQGKIVGTAHIHRDKITSCYVIEPNAWFELHSKGSYAGYTSTVVVHPDNLS
jgi:hypothetical protein